METYRILSVNLVIFAETYSKVRTKSLLLQIACNLIHVHISESPPDRCNPSPCGSNAQCNDGVCTCISEYFGDAYVGCRPECVINTDCSRDRACVLRKCRDPCVGTCGVNAECNVVNHLPMCSCPRNMTGNAFISCQPFQGSYSFVEFSPFFAI